MNGNLMYEVARQRLTEQRQAARQAGRWQRERAAARGRRAKAGEPGATATARPAIPDYAEEMFPAATRAAVPAPRPETPRGRPARTGR